MLAVQDIMGGAPIIPVPVMPGMPSHSTTGSPLKRARPALLSHPSQASAGLAPQANVNVSNAMPVIALPGPGHMSARASALQQVLVPDH